MSITLWLTSESLRVQAQLSADQADEKDAGAVRLPANAPAHLKLIPSKPQFPWLLVLDRIHILDLMTAAPLFNKALGKRVRGVVNKCLSVAEQEWGRTNLDQSAQVAAEALVGLSPCSLEDATPPSPPSPPGPETVSVRCTSLYLPSHKEKPGIRQDGRSSVARDQAHDGIAAITSASDISGVLEVRAGGSAQNLSRTPFRLDAMHMAPCQEAYPAKSLGLLLATARVENGEAEVADGPGSLPFLPAPAAAWWNKQRPGALVFTVVLPAGAVVADLGPSARPPAPARESLHPDPAEPIPDPENKKRKVPSAVSPLARKHARIVQLDQQLFGGALEEALGVAAGLEICCIMNVLHQEEKEAEEKVEEGNGEKEEEKEQGKKEEDGSSFLFSAHVFSGGEECCRCRCFWR